MAIKCNIANPSFGENVVFTDAYIKVKEFVVRSVTEVRKKTNVLTATEDGKPIHTEQVPETDAQGNVLFDAKNVVMGHAYAYANKNARALECAPVAVVNFQFDLPADQTGNIVAWVYEQLKQQPQFTNATNV